ncbi:hypothetical protein HAALTHF_48570n [Vreelandella aquamarina]|nr:hypothetical protein HAALTHF_48570n [Halomonas axialensis]
MQEIQRNYPETDAIFCTNDDVAVGAYFECLRQGIGVPEHIAIAGFHGHDVGQAMTPRLASVVTPRKAIGEAAAKSPAGADPWRSAGAESGGFGVSYRSG